MSPTCKNFAHYSSVCIAMLMKCNNSNIKIKSEYSVSTEFVKVQKQVQFVGDFEKKKKKKLAIEVNLKL